MSSDQNEHFRCCLGFFIYTPRWMREQRPTKRLLTNKPNELYNFLQGCIKLERRSYMRSTRMTRMSEPTGLASLLRGPKASHLTCARLHCRGLCTGTGKDKPGYLLLVESCSHCWLHVCSRVRANAWPIYLADIYPSSICHTSISRVL